MEFLEAEPNADSSHRKLRKTSTAAYSGVNSCVLRVEKSGARPGTLAVDAFAFNRNKKDLRL